MSVVGVKEFNKQFVDQLDADLAALAAAIPSGAAGTVDDLAALKALQDRPASVIVKTGQAAGEWAWFPGDTTTADDALVVQCTSGAAGRYKRLYSGPVNVMWFGAKGDLVTDDSAAIQAAAAAGKDILFPAKKTFLFGNVTLTDNQAAFCDASYFQAAPGCNFLFKLTGFNPRLIGPYIANHAQCAQAAVVIGSSTSARLENFCVLNGVNAIRLESTCSQPLVTNGWINTFTGVGVDLVAGTVINPKFSDVLIDSGQVGNQPRVGAIGVRCDTALTPSFTDVWTVNSEYGWIFKDCEFPNTVNCKADTHGNWGVQVIGGCSYPDFTAPGIGTCGAGLRVAGTTTPARFKGLQVVLTNTIPPGGSAPFFTASSPYDISIEDTANVQIDADSMQVGTNWNVGASAVLKLTGGERFYFKSSAGTSAGATEYYGPSLITSDEGDALWLVPYNCYIVQFIFNVNSAPGVGQTMAVTVRKNSSDTSATDTISGNADFQAKWRGAVSASEGDYISIKSVSSGSAASANVWGLIHIVPR